MSNIDTISSTLAVPQQPSIYSVRIMYLVAFFSGIIGALIVSFMNIYRIQEKRFSFFFAIPAILMASIVMLTLGGGGHPYYFAGIIPFVEHGINYIQYPNIRENPYEISYLFSYLSGMFVALCIPTLYAFLKKIVVHKSLQETTNVSREILLFSVIGYFGNYLIIMAIGFMSVIFLFLLFSIGGVPDIYKSW